MNKIDEIIDHLIEGIPMAIARFNDGEMSGINLPGCTIARGDQVVDRELQLGLVQALQHKQLDYYRGLPCGTCWPLHRKLADKIITGFEDRFLTSAVVLTNRNIKKFIEAFKGISKEHKIYWIGGTNQSMQDLYQIGGIKTTAAHMVTNKDSWTQYEMIKNTIEREITIDACQHNIEIFAFSCGPMSRVLVHTLFKQFPNKTFLDLGAVFDHYTKDYWLGCHDGTLAPCPECN